MAAIGDTSGPDSPARGVHLPLEEAAWLYQADQVCPEDLPMTAAQALAVGVDTPSLCGLAGLSRHADPRDIRDTFEQALAELGIALPDHRMAQRYALRRLATRFTAGEAALTELASEEWLETEVETAEEQAFVALLPPCACCIEYTLGLDEAAWEVQLRIAARALVSHPTVGPGI
ncbi:cobalamin biosynthesis protein [Streptomyces shenzhenensis]|uniref:cobalamin biosynthesis protein n=2 Tax=Streptomyces shenzhenensis TaxID=943815 RepID=UPI0037F4D1D6